jgi:uncharacterized protein (DUF849 family)
MSLADKLIINVAPTGMVPTKQDNPDVPVTPDEIAEDVRRCRDAGGSIFHLHARDDDGAPDYRIERYRTILEEVRARCPNDIILCLTTSGRVYNTFEKRSEVLDLEPPFRPDMASLTLGSMNFPKQASVNPPDMIKRLAGKMNERGIVPELEVFEPGMIDFSTYLIRKQILREPLYYNLLLGSLGTSAATARNLVHMVDSLPEGATWAATGVGTFQFGINALAISMGGHVRVGLEDAIFMDANKTDPATNVRLVERIVKLARAAGREPATPDETRRLIGLEATA